MKNNVKNIVIDKFCRDIELNVTLLFQQKFRLFHNQFKRYSQKDEKLEFIQSKKKEILKYLEGSPFEMDYPQFEDFEANLNKSLTKYFKNRPLLSRAIGWEFSENLKQGKIAFDSTTRKILVPNDHYFSPENPHFSFADLDHFKHLPEYIANNILLARLKKLENEITSPNKKDEPAQLSPNLTDTQRDRLNDLLKNWILPDSINKFIEIENELNIRGYIDNRYKWQKGKTKIELAEFVCLIDYLKFFKSKVDRKMIQDFHKRQFLSERYGFGKTGLTETWKKNKLNINPKLALGTFFWMKPMVKSLLESLDYSD